MVTDEEKYDKYIDKTIEDFRKFFLIDILNIIFDVDTPIPSFIKLSKEKNEISENIETPNKIFVDEIEEKMFP